MTRETFVANAKNIDFRDVASIDEIPLNEMGEVCVGYIPPRKCRRYEVGNLLEHNDQFVYIGQDQNFACLPSDLHGLGRALYRVKRIRKDQIDNIVPLETRVSYNVK